MSDNLENKPVDGENTPEPIEKKEFTEVEQRAMEMGWRPKEEFNGNDADFIDAGEFVRRKPLFDKIEQSSREVKQLRQAFNALKGHYTTVKEAEYQRALTALKNARKEALSAGDGDRFEAIDEEIKRVEADAATINTVGEVEEAPQIHPEFAAWLNQNPWYNSDRAMRIVADDIGKQYAGKLTPAEVLKRVAEEIKQKFPNSFRNPNKDSAPDVTKPDRNSGKKSTFELTPQEEQVFKTLNRSDPKTFTREKYIEQIKLVRGN